MLTSFLESASHTKAATAIPALLCTIAALYKRNSIHHLKIWLKWSSCEFHGKNWAIHYRLMCYGYVRTGSCEFHITKFTTFIGYHNQRYFVLTKGILDFQNVSTYLDCNAWTRAGTTPLC